MPNYTVRITGGGAQVPWTDPASENPPAPSRLNPNPIHPHTYRRVVTDQLDPDTEVTVTIEATVAGVEGPLDVDLGGDLFTGAWASYSGPFPPPFSQPAGQSSVFEIKLTSVSPGHFVFRVARANGGHVLVHFDNEAVA